MMKSNTNNTSFMSSAPAFVDRKELPPSNKPLVPEEESSGYIADKTVKAEKRIQAFPFDTEAWSILIRDAQIRKIEDARATYERLVEQFPNAGKYWKIFIEHEVAAFVSLMAQGYEKPPYGAALSIRDYAVQQDDNAIDVGTLEINQISLGMLSLSFVVIFTLESYWVFMDFSSTPNSDASS